MTKSKTYSDKLRSPKWQRKRLEILTRDNFSCRLCGDKETELHIHHLEYSFGLNPWEYSDDKLITYCKHCHLCVEYIKNDKVQFIANRADKLYIESKEVYAIGVNLTITTTNSTSIPLFHFNPTNEDLYLYLYLNKDIISMLHSLTL